MIVLLALDDNNGMMFNHRRQSRDKYLREEIQRATEGKTLWMNRYSFAQFKDVDTSHIRVSEDFLREAKAGDCCFVENEQLESFQEKIEELWIYRWNRIYPQDRTLDISLREWKLTGTKNFPGKSHEKITKEVYSK